MIDIIDGEPEWRIRVSAEERQRVSDGFKALVAAKQRQIDAEAEEATNRHRSAIQRANAFWDRLRPQEDRVSVQAPTPEAPDISPAAATKAPPREVT